MSKRDKLIQDMNEGIPWDDLDQTSKATFYTALSSWKEESKQNYTKIVNETKAARAAFENVKAELKGLLNERDGIRKAITSDTETHKRLEAENTALNREIATAGARLEGINKGLDELASRHITPDTISQVISTDAQSSEEVLSRVRTKVEHTNLVAENKRLSTSNAGLNEAIARKKMEHEELQRVILSETNKADELRRTNSDYVEIINLIILFLKRGYTIPLLKSLLDRLKQFEVDGDPKLSISRLIDALQKTQVIEALDSMIKTKTAELANLRALIAESKGIFESYKGAANATLKALETDIKQRLEALYQEHHRISEQALDQLKVNLETYTTSTNSVRATTLHRLNQDLNSSLNLLLTAQNSVEEQLQNLKGEIESWGEIKKESGRNEHLLQQAAILLAFQKDKTFIAQMPPDLIVSLLRSIDIYIQTKLPTAETKPSKQIYERDRWGLSSMYTTKVTSVSSWLLEALTILLLEGKL